MVTDTTPGIMAMAVEEENGTEDGLSLEMETGEGTGPVVSAEKVGSENTDSVVWLAMSVMEVSIGRSVAGAVELAPSRMLVTTPTRSEVDGSKPEKAPVVPGPVMPSRVEDGASVTVDPSSPVMVLLMISSAPVLVGVTSSSETVFVGTAVLSGSSSSEAVLVTVSSETGLVGSGVLEASSAAEVSTGAAIDVSMTMGVEETPVPPPLIPDSVSTSRVGVALLLSCSKVEVGSSDEVRTPDGPKVISFSVLVSSSSRVGEGVDRAALVVSSTSSIVDEGVDRAALVVSGKDSEVVCLAGSSELVSISDSVASEVGSGSVLDTVEDGRMTTSGSPRVVPTSSSSVVESSDVVATTEVG